MEALAVVLGHASVCSRWEEAAREGEGPVRDEETRNVVLQEPREERGWRTE